MIGRMCLLILALLPTYFIITPILLSMCAYFQHIAADCRQPWLYGQRPVVGLYVTALASCAYTIPASMPFIYASMTILKMPRFPSGTLLISLHNSSAWKFVPAYSLFPLLLSCLHAPFFVVYVTIISYTNNIVKSFFIVFVTFCC